MQLSYKYKNNFVFLTHPLVKLSSILSILILSFIFDNPVYLLLILGWILIYSAVAQILRVQAQFLKFTIFLSLFFSIVTVLLNKNGTTLLFSIPTGIFWIGNISVTIETLIYALITILRFNLVFLSLTFLNFTLDPDDLMKILLKFHLPYVLILITMLTLRFFPLLLQDMEMISEVHRTRGLELDKGNLWIRLKNRMILILPLLSNSLERSIQSSEALEARGYDVKKKRVQYYPLLSNNFHILQIFIVLCVTVVLIYLRTLQYGSFQIYPTFLGLKFASVDIIILGVWSIFNILLLGGWKLSGKPQNGGRF